MQQELISKARLVVTQLQVSICHDQIRTLHKTSNLKLCLSVTRRTCLCRAYLGCCIKGGDCRLGTARNKRAALTNNRGTFDVFRSPSNVVITAGVVGYARELEKR